MPPKLSDAPATTAAALPSNNDVVQQAAAQAAAMLGVPYITSDSDDDIDERMPPAPVNPPKNQPSTDTALPPTEPICEALPSKPLETSITPTAQSDAKQVTSTRKSESVITQPDVTMTENDGTSQNGNAQGDTPGDGVKKGQNQTAEAMVTSEQNQDPNQSTTNSGDGPTDDTINVSRSCLDGVVEQLANRITELEQIRERKKQRVERLSSAAMMAQNAPAPMWPQSAAMVAAQNVIGAGAAAGVPATSAAAVPSNFVPPATAPKVVVPPPPAPPPAPDSNNLTGERKQSRYWTADEHERFLAAIKTCGAKNYVRIAELVGTRNAKQVRTHAQKFQKKLEREEAKRRDDLRRHGGAAAASSVSAAAVAAAAAAAACMHQGGHIPLEQAAAYPHLLLPYAHAGVPMMGAGVAPPGGPTAVGLPRVHDGSSSTNMMSMERRHTQVAEQFVAPETVAAAVAAEAAALGSRVYSRPAQFIKSDGNKNGSGTTAKANATTTNQAATGKEGQDKKEPPMGSGAGGSGSGSGVGGGVSGTETKNGL